MSRFLLVCTITSFLLLSGCVGGAAPKAPSPSATTAGSATVTPDSGGIDGVVTTDEQVPVGSVEVGLVEVGLSTKTDADGRFVFSEIAPGTYQIVAQRIGYASAAKRVTVVAGEQTPVVFVLEPMEVVEAYQEGPYVFDGYIQAGGLLIDVAASDLSSVTGVGKCAKCNLYFNTTSDSLEIVFELKFTPTVTNPVNPNVLEFQLWSLDADGGLKENYATDVWGSGEKRSFNQETALPGSDGGPMPRQPSPYLWFSYCDALFVCQDQRFQIYYTVFHNGRAPENFTALPT